MGTDKRARQKANRAAKIADEQKALDRKRRIRFVRNAVILLVFILLLLFLLSCSSPTTSGDAGKASGDYGTTPCPTAKVKDPKDLSFDAPFERCIDPAKSYTAVVRTTLGEVRVALDTKNHPVTANNFVALARAGYYDNTRLFRTEAVSGIIQGGSPRTQNAMDPGPGYTITDEGGLATSADYGPGALAMARTSQPDSAGAQFFFLAGEGGRYLGDPSQPGAGSYRVFGKVTSGLDVLEKIAALDNGDSTPREDVRIESVTILES